MPQTVITAKWTDAELALMDALMPQTGAQSRSHLLRIALLQLAEDQAAPAVVLTRAYQSRLDHPYRVTARATRVLTRALTAPPPPAPKTRPRRRA